MFVDGVCGGSLWWGDCWGGCWGVVDGGWVIMLVRGGGCVVFFVEVSEVS